MANCRRRPWPPPPNLVFLLLIIANYPSAAASGLFASFTTTPATGPEEVESMMTALRSHGSTLFINAIATSDLKYEIFAASPAAVAAPFTIFAPKDTLLYALDMISDSDTYISTLRYHVVPKQRHTYLDLVNLSSPFLDTLLPHYSVLIGKTQQDDDGDFSINTNATSVAVLVDGVRITSPDLFLGSTIAVHGIDGILVTGLNMYQDSDISSPGIFDGDPAATLSPQPLLSPDWSEDWKNSNAHSPAPAPAPEESPKKKKKKNHGRKKNNNNSNRKREKRENGHHGRRRRHRRLRGHRLDDL
ncbi:fasciclin-like arabinogalactan protein 19 [Andrographis paniculata]|uniref:fasciclin-like arabinogalactan protein 19 n=1 Tax=Andrographis paniculata TaxID=175694 RepID=UPI0021E95F24|nr:fasciclin-like arabinogalactan protein 19 [Andrographis paniculata]